MKALSVRQPWAWLIVNGHKDVENRSWPTNHRGPVIIHAAKRPDPNIENIRRYVEAERGIGIPRCLDFGGIVGMAVVTACVIEHDSPWFSGPYAFVFEHARPLTYVPCPGRLGLFDIDVARLAMDHA